MADIFNMTDTWNAGATTFTAIKMNVTDSASASGSLLLDLQVGGSSKFKTRKDGYTNIGSSYILDPANGNFTIYPYIYAGNTPAGLRVRAADALQWASSTDATAAADTILARDAANTLALRNSTNAQTFNVYNTYTDASNYERGFIGWSGNIFRLGSAAAGTGTTRDVRIIIGSQTWDFQSGGATVFPPNTITVSNSFSLTRASGVMGLKNDSLTTGAAFEMTEQTAPAAGAANTVRIYAQDNGAGKTQLMALFASGAAQQIAIQP